MIDVIQQEATEDVQRISGAPVTTSYFETSFVSHLYRRGFVLGPLLILESVTSVIMSQYDQTLVLSPILVVFIATLVSTGGNTSGQTSAIAIQGMTLGDINESNTDRFIRREFFIGSTLAIVLSIIAFVRVYASYRDLVGSLVVSISLGLVVLISVLLGACFPVALTKLKIDPAYSAGPLLATLMDILGISIYCYVAYMILS